MSFVSYVSIDTDGSATDTLVTAAFTTSGSNRHIDVAVGIRASGGGATVPSITRTGTTFTHQRTDDNPTGSVWHTGSFWITTAEPQTGSAAATIVLGASNQFWGASFIILDDVNQTTRIRGGTVSLNPDGDTTVDALVLASAAGDLVVSTISGTTTASAGSSGGTETDRGSWNTGSSDAWGIAATAPGATTVNLDWATSLFRFVHYAVSHPLAATAPSATVPGDGICINIYGETAVAGISVTEGTSSITSIATTCTAGATMTYDATGTSVSVSENGTDAPTLSNGASETEYNTVLATLTMRGTTVDTTITVTVIPTDGTLNDNETFDVFCDPNSLTCTGSNADVIAWAASVKVRILDGFTNDTISVHIEDDTGTPLEVDSSFIAGVASYFNIYSGFSIKQLLRRRRKKKSGN